MHAKTRGILLLAIAPALLLAACGDGLWTAAVSVRVPAPPAHWSAAFPDLRFVARYVGPDGAPVEQAVEGGTASVILPRTVNAPVLVVPLARGEELPPAGSLYPWSLRGEGRTLEATWKDGCAALILYRLQAAGFDVAALNGRRLRDELQELEDPWRVDGVRIAEAFLADSVSSALLTASPSRSVSLVPGAGTWFLDSPFARAFRVEEGRILSLGSLAHGHHRLFESGGGAPIGIQVGEEGVTVFTD